MVPLLSTSKADSGLASEFRRDRAIYTAYERMLKVNGRKDAHIESEIMRIGSDHPVRATLQHEAKQAQQYSHNRGLK